MVEGKELWYFSRAFGIISEVLIKYYFAHIIKGLEGIHEKGIIHRDIKAENILLTQDR